MTADGPAAGDYVEFYHPKRGTAGHTAKVKTIGRKWVTIRKPKYYVGTSKIPRANVYAWWPAKYRKLDGARSQPC